MRRSFALLAVLVLTQTAPAAGLLIPTEKKVPPLAMLNHQVTVLIDDQVAQTTLEQTFRNHTDRQLEATYIFPVPKGASVRKFSMWVDNKEVPGELVEADKARSIYNEIVRRTQDPGLLEYMGNDVLKLRVFPVLAKSDQKVKISYTSIADSDNGLIEYRYPFKTDGKAVATLEKFSMNVKLRSQHALQNLYSPSHSVTISRPNDREASVGFEKDQAVLDRDFQLFYTTSNKDVGVTAVTHRPSAGQPGYFMLLVAPRSELSRSQQVPRDMVFVLDTSGSMRGKRLTQAKAALKYCLSNLNTIDRFNLIHFATAVNTYQDRMLEATPDNLAEARKWVDNLEATGGTAINDALARAFDLNPGDMSRIFNVVFFTDGRPTIGETNSDKILQNVARRNTSNVRLFTFGVGDDVNASMLDKLADDSRAVSTYVRETEDIEAKVSSLYSKISNPVLANLRLSVEGSEIRLSEMYPQQLPDLFHGSQLVVFGRYTGQGHAAIKLTGTVASETRDFVYEVNFPEKSTDDKTFVEDLWARRKVGFLLDQVRLNGEKKELVDEVVTLAKRYGITTPYTSYLVVPDNVALAPIAGQPRRPDVRFNLQLGGGGGFGGGAASGLAPASGPAAVNGSLDGSGKKSTVEEAARRLQLNEGEARANRDKALRREFETAEKSLHELGQKAKGAPAKEAIATAARAVDELKDRYHLQIQAAQEFRRGTYANTQQGTLGVNFSVGNAQLRNQAQVTQTATRWLGTRNALEVGGIWIDEAFSAEQKTVPVKAQSEAYFRILERHPETRNVFRIANHLVWVTPSRQALVIDPENGADTMSDADIDALFAAAAAEKK